MTSTIARNFSPEDKKRYDKNKKTVIIYSESVKLWLDSLYEIWVKQDYLQEAMTWEKWCLEYIPWKTVKAIERMLKREAAKLSDKTGSTEVGAQVEPQAEGELVDETGFTIPEHLRQTWSRRKEINTLTAELSALRRLIEKAWEKSDPVAMKIDQSIIEDLKAAYHCVSKAKLYCVCGTCQGWYERVSGGTCRSCNSTGFMSKDQYDRLLPEQVKTIRARGIELAKK
ncbi:MAG TPA: hypothetical protein VLK33_04745 [Terriglobales bacterium]|nr:hypothetical protein [Terriglobales bacterium]